MGVSRGRSLLTRSFGVCLSVAMLAKALSFTSRRTMTRGVPRLNVATIRDADFVERMVGGERYEMVPLPDSMVAKTVFVGNLGEFVTDDILSGLFQAVSKLQSVPACVARKPNMSSMQYGVVHFLTVEEKEVRSAHWLHPLPCPPTHVCVGCDSSLSRNRVAWTKNKGGRDSGHQSESRPCTRKDGRVHLWGIEKDPRWPCQ